MLHSPVRVAVPDFGAQSLQLTLEQGSGKALLHLGPEGPVVMDRSGLNNTVGYRDDIQDVEMADADPPAEQHASRPCPAASQDSGLHRLASFSKIPRPASRSRS